MGINLGCNWSGEIRFGWKLCEGGYCEHTQFVKMFSPYFFLQSKAIINEALLNIAVFKTFFLFICQIQTLARIIMFKMLKYLKLLFIKTLWNENKSKIKPSCVLVKVNTYNIRWYSTKGCLFFKVSMTSFVTNH